MLFSRKELVKITVPLIIQQVLAVLIGMADTMMVSSKGEAAVSGVSLVTSLDTVLIILFSSMVTGGAVVVSQALGQGDKPMIRNSAKQLYYVATGIALAVSCIVLVFRVFILNILFGDAEAAVLENALSYFSIMALSFPFLAMENAGAALFRTMGNSTTSMLISVGMNLLNVAGNALLIYGFDMGVTGAALSTLFARIVGAAVATALLYNKKNPVYLEKLLHFRPDFDIIKKILKIGIPSGIENSMFQFGKLITQSLISSLGTVSIAANAVAISLVNFQYMPGNAIGLAVVTVVGRCVGAGEQEQAKKYARGMLATTYGLLWGVNLVTLIFADPMIALYEPSEETTKLIKFLLLSHAAVTSIIWPIAFTTPSIFRSASDVKYPMVVSVFSMWVFRVAFGYLLTLDTISFFGFSFSGPGLGVTGIWIAMYADWVFRTILFGIRFFKGTWLTKYKKE